MVTLHHRSCAFTRKEWRCAISIYWLHYHHTGRVFFHHIILFSVLQFFFHTFVLLTQGGRVAVFNEWLGWWAAPQDLLFFCINKDIQCCPNRRWCIGCNSCHKLHLIWKSFDLTINNKHNKHSDLNVELRF